jgi:hypothetical protein
MKRSVIYKAIRNKAKLELGSLKFIDLQKGQMNNQRQNYPVPLPALFIEIGNFSFTNQLHNAQKGAGTISFYLYVNNNADSFSGAENEDHSIELLDDFDTLFETFQDMAIENCTPLIRTNEFKPQYGKGYIMFQVDFTTVIDDAKDQNNATTPKPIPDFTPKYKFE